MTTTTQYSIRFFFTAVDSSTTVATTAVHADGFTMLGVPAGWSYNVIVASEQDPPTYSPTMEVPTSGTVIVGDGNSDTFLWSDYEFVV